jgi:hypothetical protein
MRQHKAFANPNPIFLYANIFVLIHKKNKSTHLNNQFQKLLQSLKGLLTPVNHYLSTTACVLLHHAFLLPNAFFLRLVFHFLVVAQEPLCGSKALRLFESH